MEKLEAERKAKIAADHEEMAKMIDARLEEFDGKLTTMAEEAYKEKKDPKESVDEAFKKLMREEGPKAPAPKGDAKPEEKKDGPQKLEAKKAGGPAKAPDAKKPEAKDAKKADAKKPEEKKK